MSGHQGLAAVPSGVLILAKVTAGQFTVSFNQAPCTSANNQRAQRGSSVCLTKLSYLLRLRRVGWSLAAKPAAIVIAIVVLVRVTGLFVASSTISRAA
jgi:hypothetical protein